MSVTGKTEKEVQDEILKLLRGFGIKRTWKQLVDELGGDSNEVLKQLPKFVARWYKP